MNTNKRKRNQSNNNEISPERTSKKQKNTEVHENSSAIEQNNQEDDLYDSLIFEGSVVENDDVVPVQTLTTNALKVNVASEPKQRKQHKWIDSEWESLEQAEEFLDSEGFVLFDDKDLKIGQKFYFRCRKIPRDRKRSEWCAAQYIIFLPADSNKIILQYNGCDHNHNALLSTYKLRPVSDNMKVFLNDLFDSGVTRTSAIKKSIAKARVNQQLFIDEPDPTTRQISYLLSKHRTHETQPIIHMGDMMKWCEERTALPTNPDDAFVIGYECSTNQNDQSFNFCLSTLNLLAILSNASVIAIDATYKLNWMGYPLIILGIVDNMKKFHPMIYCCSSHERTSDYTFVFQTIKDAIALHLNRIFQPELLVADGADAIRNGFYNVHKDSAKADIMCFAHVLRNVRKRPFTSKTNKQLIIDDIRKIQLASSKHIFDLMTSLFLKKWENLESNFIEYFKKEWLGAHKNWFEGISDIAPSTNNAVESHNATIKRKITFRRRLPLIEFLLAMLNMTADISKQFTNGLRHNALEPNIPRDVVMKGAQLENDGFKVFKATTKSGIQVQVLPAQKCPIENATYKFYQSLVKRQWSSFDEYMTHGYQMFWIVQFKSENWKVDSSCTCPVYFKQRMCKHILAIAMRDKVMECPQNANPVILAAKRRQGRPKNSSQALMRD